MINIDLILNNPDIIKNKMESRNFDLDLELIKKLSTARKRLITEKESISAEKNILVKKFNEIETDSEKENLKNQSKVLENKINDNKTSLSQIQTELDNYLLTIPNIPDEDVPVGKDETSNIVNKEWGSISKSKADHSEIFKQNNLIDFETAALISRSRFVVLRGEIAKLHRALINFMLTTHTEKYNYHEYNIPYLVNDESLVGTGQLPKFATDLFKIENEKLFLIPTAEVPLTSLHRDKVLSESQLPLRLVAHSPCFRSEAGSYGKDTKGMIRHHQFEKVELVQLVKPSESKKALEELTLHCESILEMLEIPFRRVSLSTGDLGFSASKTYDLEAWMPGQNKYREVSSCSNFKDFQSRRLNIKYKDTTTKKKDFVHTLNGSGLAIGRTLAALVENNFDNNIIKIPDVLHKFTGFKTIKL
ncbi:MAG: serine--tRNA ligase [Pseudomonadota bacterium]|nr:serine--tRNA ligase [Pseudomonadota bacterium]